MLLTGLPVAGLKGKFLCCEAAPYRYDDLTTGIINDTNIVEY